MADTHDKPSTPLSHSFIADAHTINKLTLLLDDEFTENIHQSIKLSLQLSKLDHSNDYYHALKQELTSVLAEVGLVTMWMYKELLLSDAQGEV